MLTLMTKVAVFTVTEVNFPAIFSDRMLQNSPEMVF